MERCSVQSVAGDSSSPSRHATTILYNGRGGEIEVKRLIQWKHNNVNVFVLCHDAARAPSTIFNVGDTMYTRLPSRPSPASVLPLTTEPCDVTMLQPPSAPPPS